MRSVSLIEINNELYALIYNNGMYAGQSAYGPVEKEKYNIDHVISIAEAMNCKIEQKIVVINVKKQNQCDNKTVISANKKVAKI